MPASRDYVDHILELLAPLGDVKARAMFGGWGLSLDGMTFALIADDTLYLKADDGNRARFVAEGLSPFVPFPDKPDQTMSYYPPPDAAFDDEGELIAWARLGLDAALRAAARKRPRRRPSP